MTINWADHTHSDQIFIAVILFAIHFSITCVYFLIIDELKKRLKEKDKNSKSLTLFKKVIKIAK